MTVLENVALLIGSTMIILVVLSSALAVAEVACDQLHRIRRRSRLNDAPAWRKEGPR